MKNDETNSTEKAEDNNEANASQSEGVIADDMCSICLNGITNRALTDACSHRFCYECLNHWSAVHNRCPVCRQEYQNIRFGFRSADEYEERAVTARESDDETFQIGFRNGLVAYMNLLSERHHLVSRVEQLRRELSQIQLEQQIISEIMRGRQISLEFLERSLVDLEARVSAANPYPSLIDRIYSQVELQSESQSPAISQRHLLVIHAEGLSSNETQPASGTIELISPVPSQPIRIAQPFFSSFTDADQQTEPVDLSTNRIDSAQTGLSDQNVDREPQSEPNILPSFTPVSPLSTLPSFTGTTRPDNAFQGSPSTPSSLSRTQELPSNASLDRNSSARLGSNQKRRFKANNGRQERRSLRRHKPYDLRQRKSGTERKDGKTSADKDQTEPKQ